MAIILDAMGSDNYPDPEIIGAVEAKPLISDEIILVGKKELILSKMNELSVNKDTFKIIDAPEIVEMWEKPVESAKKKPNNPCCR